MEQIAGEQLPEGYGFKWTELALQERLAGSSGPIVFAASIVFVFLLLAAQYESWTLPLAVMLIVPMCLLSWSSPVSARMTARSRPRPQPGRPACGCARSS